MKRIIGIPYLEEGHLNCLLPVIEELKRQGFEVDIYYAHEIKTKFEDTLKRISTHCATVTNYSLIFQLYKDVLPHPYIMMMHGVALWKKSGGLELSDLCLVSHKWNVMQYRKIYGNNKVNMKIIGFPKLDGLVKKMHHRRQIRQEFIKKNKLDPNKPIIAFLPTWEYKTEADSELPVGTIFQLDKIDFTKIPNFIIGVHNMIGTKPGTKKREILDKAKYTYNQPNKEELLLSADVIVGDVSSILLESLIVDIPIIHIHRGSFAPFELNDNEGYDGLITVGCVRSIERLEETISYVLKYDDYKLLRHYWRERLLKNSEDGKASERAVKEIVNCLEVYKK